MNLPTSFQPTTVFESYWRFAAERQRIFQKRLVGDPQPWTTDPILSAHKFTNVFRACDRVSQYLIRNVIYNPESSAEAEEVVFRILLFKFFNRISTWETLVKAFGTPTWKGFNETAYLQVLDNEFAKGRKIFSAAYMHNDLQNYAHVSPKKHPRYIRLLKEMMSTGVTAKLQATRTYQDAFRVLNSYPLHAGFIGMQHLCDLNYSEVINFDEDDFIVAGPGALDGIRKCFGVYPTQAEAALVIQECVRDQEGFFEYFGLAPVTLFGRRLHAIDCQNLFCEIDKVARVAHPQLTLPGGRSKIKQTLQPLGSLPKAFFPPKWKIKPLEEEEA